MFQCDCRQLPFHVLCRYVGQDCLGVVMSAEGVREYYRKQGEQRVRERMLELLDKYIFGGLVVVPVEDLLKLIKEGQTNE